MNRLTTDAPAGNFETILNFVYVKDGWAYIRHDGEEGSVPLTQWAKAQCILHGCEEFSAETPQEIDEAISDCMMDFPDCPIALAYCFASQAVHLRSRLKMYEDVLFAEDGTELLNLGDLRRAVKSNNPLTLDQLREMDGQPVYVVEHGSPKGEWYLVDAEHGELENKKSVLDFSVFGLLEGAYRYPPEEAQS